MPRLDQPLCPVCDGCLACNRDCCNDCSGDENICECEGHYCGPGPDEAEPEPEPPEDDSYVPGDYDPPEERGPLQ